MGERAPLREEDGSATGVGHKMPACVSHGRHQRPGGRHTRAGQLHGRCQPRRPGQHRPRARESVPTRDRARHRYRINAANRHGAAVAAPEPLGILGDRRRAGAVDAAHAPVRASDQRHQIATDGGLVRVDNRQRCGGYQSSVHCIAAVAEGLSAGLGREVMRGGDRAEAGTTAR